DSDFLVAEIGQGDVADDVVGHAEMSFGHCREIAVAIARRDGGSNQDIRMSLYDIPHRAPLRKSTQSKRNGKNTHFRTRFIGLSPALRSNEYCAMASHEIDRR